VSTLGQFLQELAGTIHVWRDGAIATLAVIVIACLWLYASAVND